MLIAELDIKNFRGIRAGRVRFGTFTVLIGANNSGKTTITEALALLFGRDRLVRTLTEHDFSGSVPEPQDRIRIVATIIGFAPNDPDSNSCAPKLSAVIKIMNSQILKSDFTKNPRMNKIVDWLVYLGQVSLCLG
jgi:predicted ATP-dependent endonuclease of OLD family